MITAATSLLPIAVLSPFGGVVADRCNRKHVMMLADGCAGLFSLILALIVANGFLNVGLIILLLTVRATAQAFHSPALSALMLYLVPERHLVRINSMDQSITSIASIAGPATGILLYTLVGLPGVMLLIMPSASLSPLMIYQYFGGDGWMAQQRYSQSRCYIRAFSRTDRISKRPFEMYSTQK